MPTASETTRDRPYRTCLNSETGPAAHPVDGQRPRPPRTTVHPHQLDHARIQQRLGHRHHLREDDRISPHDPPPLKFRTGITARDLMQPPRPARLLFPAKGLIPPAGHHRMRQSEHPLRL
ncbi:hypothetical protein [Streptomyces sp. NPDC014734]|uniref:hypothetical protein n=1 Tax=Streptomyces sp. NPDC014734 TaxID=3364886 RepID=UPI0036FA349C